MKKIHLFALAILGMALQVFAQGGDAIRYQGLDGSFIKFGKAAAGFRDFEIRVDYDPFHFVAKGKVNAGPQTEDLDLLTADDISIAFAYSTASKVQMNGITQYPAVLDIAMLAQDEETRIKDLKIELLPPLTDDASLAALKSAPQHKVAFANGSVTAAMADPWSMSRKDAKKQVVSPQKTAPIVAPAAVVSAPAPAATAPVAVPLAPVEERSTAVVPNTNGAPSDKEGFTGTSKNRKRVGIALAALGGILVIYGILQHSDMNSKLDKMHQGENAMGAMGRNIADPTNRMKPYDLLNWENNGLGISGGESYNDLENQKKGAETRRNLALGLGAISIGGSIVMFTF